MEKYLVLVAGGQGSRVSKEIPKQFLKINGIPLLLHTFNAFYQTGLLDQFVLVLPKKHIQLWNAPAVSNHFPQNLIIRESGPERYHSVKSGLEAVPNNVLVAVHDAVRPFVSKDLISQGFERALRKKNAVPAVRMEDSLREVSGPLSRQVDRENYRRIQTPQFFWSSIIKKAYQQPYNELFTDDATVLEAAGEQIHLFDGDPENIKITYPADLAYAEYLLNTRS